MKREIKSVVAMLLATGLVAGCGMLKTSKKNQKADQITMALSGEWNSACQKQGWLGFTQLTEAYTFSALGDFEKRSAVFRDNCATPDLVVETGGTYDDLGAAVDPADAKNINFTVSQASMTPKSDAAVTMLNTMKYCAIEDWAVNKKSDILDKKCVGIGYKKGEVVFDIYRQNDSQLVFGKKGFSLVGETASNRPNKLNELRTFTKK